MKNILTLILFFIFASPVYSKNTCEVVCKWLVAYYPFNGDAKDKSGNGQNAKVVGATLTKDRKGNPKSAYRFDGIDDYIETGGLNQSLINKNGLSYMAIVKIAAIDPEKIRRMTDDKPYVAPIITGSNGIVEWNAWDWSTSGTGTLSVLFYLN